jgi:epoxyqueuosine reductase QueG
MTDEEQRMSFHEYTEHIERKGEARERAQSILRERQSIISFAADLLPPERIEQLQSMQDLDLLTKAIQAALRERVR